MSTSSLYRWKPRKGSYYFAKYTLGPLIRLYFRVTWKGTEHIPLTGPVVLACNHQSNLDPLMLGLSTPRQVNFMAKIELFRIPVLHQIITSWGAFPLKRGASDPEAIRLAEEVLRSGHMLGLFPEGTRSREGNLGPFRYGAVRLALQHRATLVPMALWGTLNAMPRGARFPRPAKVRLAFGHPIDISSYRPDRPADVEEATRLLHTAVAGLLETIRR